MTERLVRVTPQPASKPAFQKHERSGTMPKVVVTGGSGKLGRAVLRDLVTHGYQVLNLDMTLPRETICPTVRLDLSDYGQVVEAISGGVDEHHGPFDAVVHLAA